MVYSIRNRFRSYLSYSIVSLLVVISVLQFHSDKSFAEPTLPLDELRARGYAKQQEGLFDEALAYYVQAAQLAPNSPSVINDMAVIYEQMGLMDRAEAMYLEALKRDPNYLPPLSSLALIAEKRGDIAQAVELINRRIAAGAPDDPWTIRAQKELQRLLDENPDFKKLYLQKQLYQLESKLNQEVEAQKEALEKARVQKAEDYFQTALAKVEQQHFAEAISDFDHALLIFPQNHEYATARRDAIKNLNKQRAQQYYEEALRQYEAGFSDLAKENIRKILPLFSEVSPEDAQPNK